MDYFPSALKHPRVAISLSILFFFCGFYTTLSPLLLGFLALLLSTSFSLFREITQPMDSLEKISPQNDVRKQQIEEIHEEIDEENEQIHEMELQDSSVESSDESISDDESLIEISLPDGNHVENDSNSFFEQGFKGESIWDFLPESVLNQTGLMELLKEINEEDNLIELDISRGSIKCSNLGIMA
ncbi:hypothetical protein LUZ60_004600 [Juncus effusus]|nr:hypothetical protein LUZ60_004600 [Juncus effusus]